MGKEKLDLPQEKKEIYVVEVSIDNGTTWQIVGEYDNEKDAVQHKREADHHSQSSESGDFRVRKLEN